MANAGAAVSASAMVCFTKWLRVPQPNGSVLMTPVGKVEAVEEEIGTAEAARILGVNRKTVFSYCMSGVLREGEDWRQNPAPIRGALRIRRSAVVRLRFRNLKEGK